MTVGYPVTKQVIDNRVGELATRLRDVLSEIQRFQALLNSTPDAVLTDPSIGYTSNDVARMKSAFADMDDLRRIYSGLASNKTLPYDYTQFVRFLIGVV